MIFFYSQSYQAFNLAVSMNLEKKIVIVTSDENIIKACKYLEIDFLPFQNFSSKEMIINSQAVKKEVNRLKNTIGNNELHFSHTQFEVFCFMLVKQMNDDKKKVIFHNFEFVYDKAVFNNLLNTNYLKNKTFQLLLQKNYNLPIELRELSNKIFVISLNLNYIKKHCFGYVDNKNTYYDLTLDLYKKIKIDYPSIENLFIAQTFTSDSLFKTIKISELLPILNNSNFTVKMHPKLGEVKGLSNCNKIPDFLPVELFLKKIKNSVISFHSASLITASKFEHLKAISLIDIVKQENDFNERVKQDLILKSDNKILFPRNIDELATLLANLD